MSLRLLPGTRPSEARQVLREVDFAATNVLGRGHKGDAILYGYLEWALEAERMLRAKFVSEGVGELLFTTRYWHLQTAAHVDLQLAPRLVTAEINDRVVALQAEQARFDAEERRWQRGRLVVLDTSALIQGAKLWEWDPAESLELRNTPIHLVIPSWCWTNSPIACGARSQLAFAMRTS